MATKKPKTVLYRRKREGKTNYAKRLKLLISGKPRLVGRVTNTRVIGQVVEFTGTGDKILAGADSYSLKKLGWKTGLKNVPASYLTGLLLGKKAVKNGCTEAIFDTGFRASFGQGRISAFLKGVVDAGLQVPFGSEEIFPSQERLNGQHLKEDLKSEVETIKQKIMG